MMLSVLRLASETLRIRRQQPIDFRVIVQRNEMRFTLSPARLDRFEFEHGDQITIDPPSCAKKMRLAPDQTIQVPIGIGQSMRLPQKYETYEMLGYKIPVHLAVLTGAGPETLEPIGKAHIANYQKFMGLEMGMSIVEIGCGIGRDALQLVDVLGKRGRYVGIDVTRDSILWCQRNISRRHRNFGFYHFDAKHELYNPLGQKTTRDFHLPVRAASVDRVLLGSVFTHLFEDEVLHYMSEMRRVLKPTGLAYATFFLYSKATIDAARRTDLTPFKLTFEHERGNGCFINDPTYPTGAVAYTDDAMRRMIASAGLRLTRSYLKGWWSGLHEQADDGQEVAILAPQERANYDRSS